MVRMTISDTGHRHEPRSNLVGCFRRSARPMHRPPRNLAEPALVWPSRDTSAGCSAATSRLQARSVKARLSQSSFPIKRLGRRGQRRQSSYLRKQHPTPTRIATSITVLVVDDDAASRDLLTTNLRREGYRTVQARGGDEALELALKLRPDAITLDVLMPKTDGWAVLGALKANPELCDIPVIMVTVAPDRGIGLSLGAAEVMTKPVDRAELTSLLRHLLSRDGPILLVEDDLATRDTVRSTIEKMGLTVAEATNGRLALSWLAENPAPALILLDLMMPEMDGFEFLDTFNRRADWRHVPVVVITAKQLTAAERRPFGGAYNYRKRRFNR